MSTRAGIGMLMPDWTIHAVYLHHDGYLFGGAGEILAKPDLFKKIYYLFKLRLRENQHNVT